MKTNIENLKRAIEIIKSVNEKLDILSWRHAQASKKVA